MPKPYLIRRPSGVYARFLVPADLRALLGQRFIVRALHAPSGDLARLAASRMAVALSVWFIQLRAGGGMSEFKKSIDKALRGGSRQFDHSDWSASDLRVGSVSFGSVQTSGPEDSEQFRKLIKMLAEMEATAEEKVAKQVAGSLLSEEIEKHLADLKRAKRATDTISESRHSLRLLLGLIGDMPINQVQADHIRAFWDGARWWPSNASKKSEFAGLSVAEIVEAGRREQVKEPSSHTMNKHRQRLAVFFNALVAGKAIPSSPMAGVVPLINTDADPETGRPFTPDELLSIFAESYQPWAKYPHRFWGPILGLYSGARVNEVAQLYREDIAQVEGVWGFHINNRFPGQKIKGKASRRFVPLAQPVIDAGFLNFVEDMEAHGHPRLFPHLPMGTGKDGKPNGLGYGRQLSRQFGAYLKKLNIEAGVAFHAFRHTIATALDRANFDERRIARITGHQVPGSVLARHYIDAQSIPERVETLAAFNPAVEVPTYTPGQFAAVLKRSGNLHT
ncbi:MAG: tyrosine-type recombinase/integrase [Pseudomonas sp.]